MVDIGNAAMQRILDRNDAQVGLSPLYRIDRVFEGGARHVFKTRQCLARGKVGIGARLALEGNRPGARNHGAHRLANALRAFSRSAGVSTLSGTASTRATAIVMPASSARSCSSFSRFSSGDGGSATKRVSASR